MPAPAAKKKNYEQAKRDKFQIKKETKFCSDSKRGN